MEPLPSIRTIKRKSTIFSKRLSVSLIGKRFPSNRRTLPFGLRFSGQKLKQLIVNDILEYSFPGGRRSQDAKLDNLSVPEVLDRAANDRRTMLDHFRAHLTLSKASPGILIVSQGVPIGQVVESIIYIWALSEPLDLCDQAHYLSSISRHDFMR